MTAAPASKEDVDTLWDHHNQLQQQHHALHNEHVELRGEVHGLQQNVDIIGRMIEDNRRARDAQHKELMDAQRENAKKLSALRTEEDKRDGMLRLGKYAAAVLTALGTLVFLIFAVIDHFKG